VLEEPDLRGLDERRQRGEDQRQREDAAVRPRVRPEAPEDLPERQRRRGGDQAAALGDRCEKPAQAGEPRRPAGLASGSACVRRGAQLWLGADDADDALAEDSDLVEESFEAGLSPLKPKALPCLRRRRWRLMVVVPPVIRKPSPL
jgi:hypothetical protein